MLQVAIMKKESQVAILLRNGKDWGVMYARPKPLLSVESVLAQARLLHFVDPAREKRVGTTFMAWGSMISKVVKVLWNHHKNVRLDKHLWNQIWPKKDNISSYFISSLTPILTLKMAKSCKSDQTSEFLDLKYFSGQIFSQIGEKNFRTKFGP